ncbi:hypothetical protein GC194_04185 [bacterium]|nr:hypothetical protein [bacterium]
MNIAVIIGISEYTDIKNNLPGCKNDAEAIYQIITKTERFGPILYINENHTSAKTKELLTNFILKQKENSIEEFFFYYSGHGEFTNDEFYYILSDFDVKKRNQTSLQNTEVDDLMRTLKPNLVVKVIDACQSGTTYIKEGNVLTKYFNDTKQGFNKCYFLNSSLNNQSSYQDKNLSHFTYSFVKSIIEHSANEIRYKDIIDVISDEFANNNEQTPFFVVQADYTEKFCQLSKDLKSFLSTLKISSKSNIDSEIKSSSIYDIIRLDAKEYIDKEGAIKHIELIGQEFEKIQLDGELQSLYTNNVELLQDFKDVRKKQVINKWIKENKTQYFTVPIYSTKFDNEWGEEYTVLDGFDLKVEVPFKAIMVEFIGNYPNLINYYCNIAFLISKKFIRFFFFITNYNDNSWDDKSVNNDDIKWVTSEVKIADKKGIIEKVDMIRQYFQKRIEKDIDEKFNNTSSDENETNNDAKATGDKENLKDTEKAPQSENTSK